jgi:hypothetical protein
MCGDESSCGAGGDAAPASLDTEHTFSHSSGVDLLIVQLKAAIQKLLDAKGVRARVLDKVNRYGEIVIGVIVEKQSPPPNGGKAEHDDDTC